MEVRWGVSSFRQWLRVRGRRWVEGECVHVCVCVTATDRFHQTKLGLYCHKYRGSGGGGMRGEEGKEEEDKEGGKEGGREDEGAACSPLIPSNIPLDDRARPKER